MPRSRHVRITRTAISPRLAMRTFENMAPYVGGMSGAGATFADVRRFAELDSTNRHALELARQGVPEGLVVVADHQTAGRGRLGRSWEAPPGSALLASVVMPTRQLASLAAGVAAAHACGSRTRLKWPNDVLLDGAKLGGILAELPDDRVLVG